MQLDFVVKKITCSCVYRQEFERCAAGKNSKSLIAGYGICWNIKNKSQRRAYKAREFRDQIKYYKKRN
jgi:hypothetical protein